MTQRGFVTRCFLPFIALPIGCAQPTSADPNKQTQKITTPAAPSSSARSMAPPRSGVAGLSVASFPNGTAFVGNAPECRVSALGRSASRRWDRALRGCDGVLFVVVAPNSIAYARTPSELTAFGADGTRLWSKPLDPVPVALARPAATLDSLVVVVSDRNTLLAFRADASLAFSFQLQGDERISASPRRSGSEGVLVTTDAAVYGLGIDGTVRWRTTFEGRRD